MALTNSQSVPLPEQAEGEEAATRSGPLDQLMHSAGDTPLASLSSSQTLNRSTSASSVKDDFMRPSESLTVVSQAVPSLQRQLLGDSQHQPSIAGEAQKAPPSSNLQSQPQQSQQCSPPTATQPLGWHSGANDVSLLELIALTCFNFPYGFICSTMGILIIPQEMDNFSPTEAGDLLSLSLFLVGVSQLVCPLAGKMSDDYSAPTAFGRRRPFVFLGWAIAGLSCLAMWHASIQGRCYFFLVALFTSMVGLNIVYSVQCCLTSDLVPSSLHGKTSGLVAVHTVSGSQVGFGLLIITSCIKVAGRSFIYPVMTVVMSISCVLVLVVGQRLQQRSREASMHRWDTYTLLGSSVASDVAEAQPALNSKDENTCLVVPSQTQNRPTEGKYEKQTSIATRLCEWTNAFDGWSDFFLVFCSRTCYYVAISCQTYMLFYMRDVIGTPDVVMQQKQLAIVVFLAQGTAAIFAYPFGRLADREGVSKKAMIYFACATMCFVYGWFLVVRYFASYAFYALLPVAIMYGCGNGCFLAVDYAIALAATPDKENAGKALGIWGVSFFIGSALGPALWYRAISIFGSTAKHQVYSFNGYAAMLLGGMAFTAAAGVLIGFVKSVK